MIGWLLFSIVLALCTGYCLGSFAARRRADVEIARLNEEVLKAYRQARSVGLRINAADEQTLVRAALKHAVKQILHHADQHAPRDGNPAQATMRRHLVAAARVVDLTTEAEITDLINVAKSTADG